MKIFAGLIASISIMLAGCGGGGGGGNISQNSNLPVAKISIPSYAGVRTVINLTAIDSKDPNGNALSYTWTISKKPADSVAILSSATSLSPTFTPDKPGNYEVTLIVNSSGGQSGTTNAAVTAIDFVSTSKANFILNGKIFKVAGSNSSGIANADTASIESAVLNMKALNFNVIRTWLYRDRGAIDGSVGDLGTEYASGGVKIWFQFWDSINGKPIYNDSALISTDKLIALANKNNIKLIMTLTNNWANFGGMDQYNIWYKSKYHDEFYSNSAIRKAYKDYINFVLNRVNTVTGVRYKDDPTIMAWELGNEPFCFTDSNPWRNYSFNPSPTCNANVITQWAQDISQYIKKIDENHMVSVGNIGFLNRSMINEYSNAAGDDFEATLTLSSVDFGTFHTYIDNPDRPYTTDWGVQWIKDHVAISSKIGKPIIMEEFGHSDVSTRDVVFSKLIQAFDKENGNGWLVWSMPVILQNGYPLEGNDSYIIPYGSSTASILAIFAKSKVQDN